MITLVFDIEGATTAQYDDALRIGNINQDTIADGKVFHCAQATEKGLLVVDFWDSIEQFDTFAHEQLGPAIEASGMPRCAPKVYRTHVAITGNVSRSLPGPETLTLVFECHTGTTLQYDEVCRLANVNSSNVPDGLVFHSCTEIEGGGFMVVDVWESEAQMRKFGERLMPAIQQVGLPTEPQIYRTHGLMASKVTANV